MYTYTLAVQRAQMMSSLPANDEQSRVRAAEPPTSDQAQQPGSQRRGRMPRMPAAGAAGAGAAKLLMDFGLVRLDGVLNPDATAALLLHCSALIDSSIAAVRSGAVEATDLLAPHLLSGNQYGSRHDVKLPLDRPVRDALAAALVHTGAVIGASIGAECE